jgi:FixJ family two-component response regulator
VALARQAFKAQASDFLEKPFDHDKLLAAIEEAFSREAHARGQLLRQVEGRPAARPDAARAEVMQLVVTGQHNRDIARARYFRAYRRSAQGQVDGQVGC